MADTYRDDKKALRFGNDADYENLKRIREDMGAYFRSLGESQRTDTRQLLANVGLGNVDKDRIEAPGTGIADYSTLMGFTSPMAMADRLWEIVKDPQVDRYLALGAKDLLRMLEDKQLSDRAIDMVQDIKGVKNYPYGGAFVTVPNRAELSRALRQNDFVNNNRFRGADDGPNYGQYGDKVKSYIVFNPQERTLARSSTIPHEWGHAETAYNPNLSETALVEDIYRQLDPQDEWGTLGSNPPVTQKITRNFPGTDVHRALVRASGDSPQGDFLSATRDHYQKPSEQIAQLFANRASSGKLYLEDFVRKSAADNIKMLQTGDFMGLLDLLKDAQKTRLVDESVDIGKSGLPRLDEWFETLKRMR